MKLTWPACALLFAACGSAARSATASSGAATSTTSRLSTGTTAGATLTSSAAATGTTANGTTSGTGTSSSTGASSITGAASTTTGGSTGGSTGSIADPSQPGAYAFAEVDSSFISSVDGTSVPVHVVYPTSGQPGAPYPVFLFAHGFTIDQSEYYSELRQAASFGYVGMTVNFATGLFASPNYVSNVTDMLSGLDFLAGASADGGVLPMGTADVTRTVASGHSLGGKLAILEAAQDARILGVLALDPVDGSTNCSDAANCPNASSVLPLQKPIGYLGETLDETGSFGMSCAPANENYLTLYALTGSPSFAGTVTGAGHISFLDSVAACGLFCSACETPTAPQTQVLGLCHTYVAAFLERYVRGDSAYDSYLTGTEAVARYVDAGELTLQSK